MLFEPRDEDEVDVLFGLVAAAVLYAGGRGVPADSPDWLKHVFDGVGSDDEPTMTVRHRTKQS